MAKNTSSDPSQVPQEAGEEVRVGEDTRVSSEASSGSVDPSASAGGIDTNPGVDSGSTALSPDYSRENDGVNAAPESAANPEPHDDSPSDAAYVDPSGEDKTKNDELPSSRDGVAKELDAKGQLQYSNGVCPLLIDEGDIKKNRENVVVGGVEQTVRQPYQVVVDPVECDHCHKVVSSHAMMFDPQNPGKRFCAIGAQNLHHPVTALAQAAADEGDEDRARRIAERHPKTNWLLKFLGFAPKEEVA